MAITEKNLLKAQLYMNLGIATKSVGDPDAAIEFLRFALNVYINAGRNSTRVTSNRI